MSDSATDRVNALIALTERLTDLISIECRAFEERRPHDVALTIDETSRLANAYRHESNRIRQNRTLIEGAALERRMTLKRATEAFDAVLARHGRALEAARIVTEGIVKAVADDVVARRETGSGYGAGGVIAKVDATAITLNRRA